MFASTNSFVTRFLVFAVVTFLLTWCAMPRAFGSDAAPPVADAPLTIEKLGEMLEAMGFEPKQITLKSGQVIHSVLIEDEGWKFVFEFSLSYDSSRVWIIAPLGTVDAASSFPQEFAVKLLEENFNIQPAAFTYVATAKKIDLIRILENKGVTATKVRSAIDQMQKTIKRTEVIWNPILWKDAKE